MNRIRLNTRLANNRESILLIGTIILVLSLLIVEVLSILSWSRRFGQVTERFSPRRAVACY